ncbi:MAG: Lrp/AsnC family transcriptional regulator [Myxococcota bacterium]|nr:Lrp/AsnC family transcriptional regulator [Myxococcota bacterium]
MIRLDDTDRQILAILQRDARTSLAALAEAVGLTATPLRARLDRLEADGAIRGYHADVDPTLVGRPVRAFVHVTMKDQGLDHHERFVREVAELPSVVSVHHIAGEEDFILEVLFEDMGSVRTFLLEKLGSISSIGRVKTSFVLDSPKHRAPVPLTGDLEPERPRKKRKKRGGGS